MYLPGPTAAELRLWGLTVDEATASADIWPDNLSAVNTFIAMSTQWRVGGMGGLIGLDYSALPAVMRMKGVPRAEWSDVFDSVRIMEEVAMDTINAQQKKAQRK